MFLTLEWISWNPHLLDLKLTYGYYRTCAQLVRSHLLKAKGDTTETQFLKIGSFALPGSQVQLLESPHHPKYTILALFALSYPIRTSMEINSLKLLFLPNRYSRDAWFAPEVLACALFCPLLDETLYPVYHMTTRHYGTHFWHV